MSQKTISRKTGKDASATVEMEHFTLRPFRAEDAASLAKQLNSKTIARDTTIDIVWDTQKAEWWISYISVAAEQHPLSEIHFAVEIGGKLAGSVAMINKEGDTAELGYWLNDSYAGQGIMTKVIDQMVRYCQQDLGIKRLFAPVLPHNKASVRVLEKNGFMLEGVLPGYATKNGKKVDVLGYVWSN